MILKEILNHFKIETKLPDYLYEQNFNDVFIKGDLTKNEDIHKITILTQKNIIHTMIINPHDDYPLIVTSTLPNNTKNGIKFGKNKKDLKYI